MGILGKIDKRIIVGIVIFALLIVVAGCIWFFTKDKAIENQDAIKFMEEYSELNGEANAKGVNYPIVNIDESNPFKYLTEEEAVTMLESGTGLIYFGFSTCPWCRNLVPNLVNAADSTNLSTIYYLDIKEIRSTKTYENKKVTTTKEGSQSYYKLIELLDEYLTEYMVYDEKEKAHGTGENRLYAPTLVGVVDGKIVGFHEGTLEEHTNGYDELSKEQIEELNTILVDLILKVTDDTCDDAC